MTTIAVFSRPISEPSKTRLASAIGVSQARCLAEAMFEAVVEIALTVPDGEVFRCSWDGYERGMAAAIPLNLGPCPSLDSALRRIITTIARPGEPFVLLPGDCPSVRPRDIVGAELSLVHHAVAILPSPDGGWSLMAGTDPDHLLLATDAQLETSETFRETLTLWRANSVRVYVGPLRRDIDRWEDLVISTTNHELDHVPAFSSIARGIIEATSGP